MRTSDLGPLIRYELYKARTSKSVLGALAGYAALSIGLSLVSGAYIATVHTPGKEPLSDFDPIAFGHSGIRLGVLFAVFAGVQIFGEDLNHAALRTSALLAPHRRRLLAAKAIVTLLIIGSVSVVVVPAAFAASYAFLGTADLNGLAGEVVVSMFGGVLYVVLLALLGLGTVAAARSVAVSLGILLPLLFMVSTLLTSFPPTSSVARFLPDAAGARAIELYAPVGALSGVIGIAILACWAMLVSALGAARFRRMSL